MGRALAAAPGLLLLALALAHGPMAGSLDDAFVVLADARAWFEGSRPGALSMDGPGVPAGGLVEGSTSLLDWAIKGVCLQLFSGWDPLRMAGWLGLIWLVAALLVTVAAVSRWTGSLLVATGVGCLVALSPGLVESAGYLLEGPLFGLLWLLALIAAAEARPGRCWAWALLLAATRPEGLALAPVLVGWAGRCASGTRRPGVAWRWVGAGVLASALVTGVRLALYGAWLPNTFHAKSSNERWTEIQDGAGYVFEVLRTGRGPSAVAVALALGVASVLWASRGARSEEPRASSRRAAHGLLAMAALYALGVVVSGGDSYTGARLFMPIALPVWLALGLLPVLWPVHRDGGPRSIRRLAGGAAIVLPLVALLVPFLAPMGRRSPGSVLSDTVEALVAGPVGMDSFSGDAEVFRGIAAALGPDETFAHLHTQRFRWFQPETPVLDLTGLTDREIAHMPTLGPVRFGRAAIDVALERRVGAIHLDPLRGRVTALVDAPDLASALSDPDLAHRYLGEPYLQPDLAAGLARHYVAASQRLPDGSGYFNLLVRRSLAEAFREQGFRVRKD